MKQRWQDIHKGHPGRHEYQKNILSGDCSRDRRPSTRVTKADMRAANEIQPGECSRDERPIIMIIKAHEYRKNILQGVFLILGFMIWL